MLGNLLGLTGFSQETTDDVRVEALGDLNTLADRLDNRTDASPMLLPTPAGLQRLSDVPIYATDALVRRSPSLQQTADGKRPVASLPSALWQQLGLQAGDRVRVAQANGSAVLPAREDNSLADNTVRVPAGVTETASLGAMFGVISVEKA